MAEVTTGNFKKVAVIMAGGSATKFWPRSTEKTPKQFIHLIGEGTMIQNTVMRLLPMFPAEDIYVVTSESLFDIAKEQLPYLPQDNIILEPFGRHTAPCLALVLTILGHKYGSDTIMAAFPADHVIYNVREFHQSMETAFRTAYDLHGIVTLGITPTRPETGYGYVQESDDDRNLGDYYEAGVRCTVTFAEKPDVATAKRFIDSGDFLWNSGIFVWRFDIFGKALDNFLPDHSQLFKSLGKLVDKPEFKEQLNTVYAQISSEWVDYAILEHADNVYVVESSFGWSDLGNWDELYRLSRKDARNNVLEGEVIAINSSNCMIISNDRLTGIVGVDNLIIINTDDSLLICKRGQADNTKEIVDFLRRKNINLYL